MKDDKTLEAIVKRCQGRSYHTLLTVYEYQDNILQSLQAKKFNNIKINNIKLGKMVLKQVFITFGDEIYNANPTLDKYKPL